MLYENNFQVMMNMLNFYLMMNMLILLMMLIMIMISVAFLTLFERKILSISHYRKGPNKISLWGLLQPFSDAMKLLSKEFFYPLKSNYWYYSLSPILMFTLIFSLWMIYPFKTNLFNWSLNSLFFLCLMSMNVYSLMISGWSSNSSFSMLGAIRSISQSISYEVTLSISFLLTLLIINSLNLKYLMIMQKYIWLMMFLWPIAIILFMSMLAEINRTPFDLSEGEFELVSGFNIEYSNYGFVLIFLSEYSSIMFMMFMFNLLFFSMSKFNFMFYMSYLMFLFLTIWIRLTLPRIRYDYLMFFCWWYLLPMILIMFFFFNMYFKFLINLI
uniref:NADH-ubiquinone oxidoreductase chain 1 n=1 Tax=Pambolus sp. QL-2013 TaxID=1421597 RepID=A0A0A6ZKV3_9HYME|nr:NADH dehydrogenase subunit 1 [Pambolus sp. QL-2013]